MCNIDHPGILVFVCFWDDPDRAEMKRAPIMTGITTGARLDKYALVNVLSLSPERKRPAYISTSIYTRLVFNLPAVNGDHNGTRKTRARTPATQNPGNAWPLQPGPVVLDAAPDQDDQRVIGTPIRGDHEYL